MNLFNEAALRENHTSVQFLRWCECCGTGAAVIFFRRLMQINAPMAPSSTRMRSARSSSRSSRGLVDMDRAVEVPGRLA